MFLDISATKMSLLTIKKTIFLLYWKQINVRIQYYTLNIALIEILISDILMEREGMPFIIQNFKITDVSRIVISTRYTLRKSMGISDKNQCLGQS